MAVSEGSSAVAGARRFVWATLAWPVCESAVSAAGGGGAAARVAGAAVGWLLGALVVGVSGRAWVWSRFSFVWPAFVLSPFWDAYRLQGEPHDAFWNAFGVVAAALAVLGLLVAAVLLARGCREAWADRAGRAVRRQARAAAAQAEWDARPHPHLDAQGNRVA
jgi:hypothetical protein